MVGAGAAGLAIATQFCGTSHDVLVLESGSAKPTVATDELNVGEVAGRNFTGLTEGRRRGLGGTTAAWGGQCREFDSIDFERRPWIAHSGWPIQYSELEPYYRRAERFLGVEGHPYDEKIWRRFRIAPPSFDEQKLHSTFTVMCPGRLGQIYRRRLERAQNVRVLMGATVTNICVNASGTVVTGVEIADATGRRANVQARIVILATGGIETPRLLLASRDVHKKGLGNANDLVGRYFQDHPNYITAEIVGGSADRLQELYMLLYRGSIWYWPKIALAEKMQRSELLLNAVVNLHFEFKDPAMEILRDIVRSARVGQRYPVTLEAVRTLVGSFGAVANAGFRRYFLGRSPNSRPARIWLQCHIEQAPSPDSRVTLGASIDALGVPRARIDWRIGTQEAKTFRAMTLAVANEIDRLGLGHVLPVEWISDTQAELPNDITDSFHHMGTARMANSPDSGVVDTNCQVFGIQGLYVAGTPTFPTSGYANPMLTLVAMSIRLADYVKTSGVPSAIK